MQRDLCPVILAVLVLNAAGCDGLLSGGSAKEVRPFSGAVSSLLACETLTFQRGSLLEGQSVRTLATQELTGRQDVWRDYVEFSPGASATCTFSLPAGADPDAVTLAMRTNYRGPRRSEMRWVFHVWDRIKRRWVLVGDNAFAADWRWSRSTMELPGPAARFVSNGRVKIRYRATSDRDASLLDEWVLLLDGAESQLPAADSGAPPAADSGAPAPAPDSAPVPAPDSGAPAPAPDSAPPPTPDSAPPPPTPAPDSGPAPTPDSAPPPPAGTVWQPTPGTSWQWQLTGTIDTSVNAQVYDIDLFESSATLIAGLQAKGRKVICYFSTAYENWRPDASSFPSSVLGNNLDGWPGERWVDIRSTTVRDIMAKRLDLAQQKGCDAVEPDNVDAYQNKPGFPLTASDGIDFLKFLAAEAHARGLSIALKNDLDQVKQLVSYFDFAINEECFQYNECGLLAPFISANKAVFQVEYGNASLATSICPKASALGFDTLIKNLDLDAWRVACN